MYFKITNGSVSYGADTVLERIDIEIRDREKIAVVGRNGCGKSTLLKAIIGKAELEEGTGDENFFVSKNGDVTIGYLEQAVFPSSEITLEEEVLKVFSEIIKTEEEMAALLSKIENKNDEKAIKRYSDLNEKYEFLGGYTYKKEYLTAIRKFGFSDEDKQKKLSEFSGGQLTKISFIKLLLSKPDILLLDEPTNHLDITTVEWLEDYLKSYRSAVVIVSHDRMFLDKIVGTVYEIEYGETKKYCGNYSYFEKQKQQNYLKQLKDHETQQLEIMRLERVIERFRYKATKAKMVQSKIKQLERLKKIDRPNRYDLKTFHTSFQPDVETSNGVLSVKDLEIGYSSPLAKLDFEIFKGDKIGIIGKNGIGKSTLLKTLTGKIPSLSGNISYGVNLRIGYFDQQSAQFRSSKTVLDEFHDEFPFMTETEARNALGAFLFSGEDVFKEVSSLSGGEKVRLALCKIFKRRPNVLIMDEPTNHMDIVGKETLENMLSNFNGTVIVVSHDRYFINKVATKLIIFEDGKTEFFRYPYSDYEERKAKEKTEEKTPINLPKTQPKKSFTSPLKEKQKREKRVLKLEQLITETEKRISEINSDLSSPEIFSDYEKVSELQNELVTAEKGLENYTDEWAAVSDELEQMQDIKK